MQRFALKAAPVASMAFALSLGLSALPVQSADAQEIDTLTRAKQLLEENPALAYDPSSMLVRFDPALKESARERIVEKVGGTVLAEFTAVPGLVHIEFDGALPLERALLAMYESKGVLYAEPDWVVRHHQVPNDPSFGNLWGLRNTGQTVNGDPGSAGADIRATSAWDLFTGDPNFVVAIIDSGTQLNHPDLAANIWTNPGEIAGNGADDDGNGYIDDVNGWDFYSRDSNPTDGGHGTHTAGTVGAVGNNGTGVVGVAWRCKLMPLRFLGANGGYTSDAVLAIQYTTAKGVKVSNNSWGGGGFSQALYDAIAASRSVGQVFVASAGNNGTNNDATPAYPATYNLDNIISVAATDNNDGRASFTNYGATTVDIGAPGVNTLSTYGTSGYAYLNGTSMAGPHVAGVAALVYGANPGWSYAQVRSRILATARPVASLSGRCVTGGIVDAAAALAGSSANTAPTTAISAPGNGASFTAGAAVTFTGSASDAQDGSLTASLAWTSSVQGALGTGGSVTRSDLVVGTHVITATATDSGGLSSSSSVTIVIASSGGGGGGGGGETPPAAPSGFSRSVSSGTVNLIWTDNSSNETGFEIQRQRRVGNQWTNTTTFTNAANDTTFSDTPGRGRWRYRVRAVNGAGASSWTGWLQSNL